MSCTLKLTGPLACGRPDFNALIALEQHLSVSQIAAAQSLQQPLFSTICVLLTTPCLADFVADILIADDNAAGSAVRDQLIKLMTHFVHINKTSFTHYFC